MSQIVYYKLISLILVMTVLFVNEYLFNPTFGGIERVTNDIVLELTSRGNFIFIYLAANHLDLEYDYPAKAYILPEKGGFEEPKNVEFYKHLLHDCKVDLVVNQRGWKPFMNNVLEVEGVPTISVVHSSLLGALQIYMSECMNHNNSLNGWWRYIVKVLLYIPYKLYKYLSYRHYLKNHYRQLVTNSSKVVLLSHKDAEELCKMTHCSKDRVCVIPNSVRIPVEPVNLEGKRKQILYVGRLCKSEKNPIRLLKIWRLLHSVFQDWSLVIVGTGDAEFEMKRYARVHKLLRVSFEGHQTSVGKYYRDASIVCLTSNLEGWGLALTEGMSYGCIPYTFDNYGAARDIIDNDINGCLIKPFDLRQYAAKLSAVMSNDCRRLEMARSAQRKAMDFSVSTVCDNWESLFSTLYSHK